MSSNVAGAGVAALCCALLSPYLASLARRAPDRNDASWWVPGRLWRRGHRRGDPAAKRDPLAWTMPLALLLGALAGAAAGRTAALPAFVALAAICTPLVVIDIAEHRLPNRLVFAAAGIAGPLLSVAAAQRHDGAALVRVFVGAAAVFAALLSLALIAPRSFGFGDVKLGGVLGGYLGWLGWPYVYCGIAAGFVLGSLVALGLLVTRRASLKTAMPFGPMLILGALTVAAVGNAPPS